MKTYYTKTQEKRTAWFEEQHPAIQDVIKYAREMAADAAGFTTEEAAVSAQRDAIANATLEGLKELRKKLTAAIGQLERNSTELIWGGRPNEAERKLIARIEDVQRTEGFAAAGRVARANGVEAC